MPEHPENGTRRGEPFDGVSDRLDRAALLRRLAVAGASLGTAAPLLRGADALAAGSRVASRAASKVTLRFWKFDDSGSPDNLIKKAIEQWNSLHPNIQVKLQTFPFNDYLATVLPTAFASGKGPDIFWISGGNLLQYANQDVLQPMDSMVRPHIKDFKPTVIKYTTVNGHIPVVPFELTPIALFYRKDILKNAGVAVPRTWPEVLAACEKLTTGKQYGIVVEPTQGTYQVFTFMPFLWMTGANTMNKAWTKSLLRTPAAASAFEFWGQLIQKGYAPRKAVGGTTADITPIGNGEAAMQVCGYWAVAAMKSTFKDVDYGVITLPHPVGRKTVSVGGGWMQAVNSKGTHVAEAMAFTKWMWFQTSFSHNWNCVANTEFSSRNNVNASCQKIQSGPEDTYFRNVVLPTARPEERYPDPILKSIGDGIQAAMFGGKSGTDAAKIAADGIDKFLKTYHGQAIGQ